MVHTPTRSNIMALAWRQLLMKAIRGSIVPTSSKPVSSCSNKGLHTLSSSGFLSLRCGPTSGTSQQQLHHCRSLSATSLHQASLGDSHDHAATEGGNDYHPRRTVMYVPASDERKTRKAATLDIDTIVLDLEDGVAVNQKDKARSQVQDALANCRTKGQVSAKSEHVIRINGFESGMLHLDLEAVFVGSRDRQGSPLIDCLPHALMLPKCDSVEQLLELDIALAFHRQEPTPFYPMKVIIIIESPIGLVNLREICSFGTQQAKHLQLSAVTFGAEDFLARLGGTRTRGSQELLYARQCIVTHAKAFGLDAIDQVDTDFKDLERLRLRAEEGARMGFTGKQVIHPDQVPVVKQAFSPSQEQVEWASGLIEAWHQHQKSGKGAFVFEGHMIDRPLLLQAENIVKLQESISQ